MFGILNSVLTPFPPLACKGFYRSFSTYTKFVNPTTDFSFKRLFGDQQQSKLLVSLLNSLLHLEEPIVSVQITDHQLHR